MTTTTTSNERDVHHADIVVIGGGPAGLTAGIYAGRGQLDVIILEKGLPGGQIAQTEEVENYPGFDEAVSGPELRDNGRPRWNQCSADTSPLAMAK